jgi:retron-type reverse transcriptase
MTQTLNSKGGLPTWAQSDRSGSLVLCCFGPSESITQTTPSSSELSTLMTEVLDSENLKRALAQVKRNKGAPGIDGMTVDDLSAHLKAHWPTIRAQLIAGSYCPKPVRRVEIPKPDGRKRLLCIPSVVS